MSMLRSWVWLILLGLSTSMVMADGRKGKSTPLPPTVSENVAGEIVELPPEQLQEGRRKQVTEEDYRVNGQTYLIKVTPVVGASYYVDGEDKPKQSDPSKVQPVSKWKLVDF